MKKRCSWATSDPLYIEYHDHEWGRPVFDDQQLFEMLCLEGQQAGLSWITILKKRDNYRKAFDRFNAKKIVKYDQKKVEALLQNPGIIRNRLKVNAIIANARAYLEIQKTHGSFSDYLWEFVGGEPIQKKPRAASAIPVNTKVSDAMAKALKKQGFKFVGSTICYAFMQAVGMVNDHEKGCFLV